jgi:hypothetical protein
MSLLLDVLTGRFSTVKTRVPNSGLNETESNNVIYKHKF